jgi:hypothetical protein
VPCNGDFFAMLDGSDHFRESVFGFVNGNGAHRMPSLNYG